jgi:MFS family permease
MVIRVGFFLMMSGWAILLVYNGRKAIRDRHFDNRWTTTTSTGVNGHYTAQTERGEEVLDGARAVRFGIGMLVAAAMLAEWSVGMAITIVRGAKAADKPTWSAMHSIATIASLVCLLTALVSLLPPERIGSRLFTSVFYGTIIVLSVVVVAAVVSNRPRFAALIFPAVALAAVFISPLAGGIIFGFFAWLALATHLLLLVPSFRQRIPLDG